MPETLYISVSEALSKAQKYCAYQERCHQEVLQKLKEWGLTYQNHGEVMALLIESGFVNEERFARSFARGKFKIKKWGRKKILVELKKRNISEYCIRMAMKEIPEEQYDEEITSLAEKKIRSLKESNPLLLRKKTGSYLISKGYEPEIVWELLKNYPK